MAALDVAEADTAVLVELEAAVDIVEDAGVTVVLVEAVRNSSSLDASLLQAATEAAKTHEAEAFNNARRRSA